MGIRFHLFDLSKKPLRHLHRVDQVFPVAEILAPEEPHGDDAADPRISFIGNNLRCTACAGLPVMRCGRCSDPTQLGAAGNVKRRV